MAQSVETGYENRSREQRIAGGTSFGAAIVLVAVGIAEFFQGLSAVAADDIFVQGQNYVYEFDFTAWGWLHLILGIVMVLVGATLFTGARWARIGAIVLAALSMLANFLWLPYYPWWSIVLIALNVVVIWAVSTWEPTRTRGDAFAHRQ